MNPRIANRERNEIALNWYAWIRSTVKNGITLMFQSLLVVAFCVFLTACGQQSSAELSLAQPWTLMTHCETPSEHELKIIETAVEAIALDHGPIQNSLTVGAQKTLGYGLTRRLAGSSIFVCTPESIMEKVGSLIKERQEFGDGQLVEYQLQLAEKIPMPNKIVVEQVGKTAFNESPQYSELFLQMDIRPMARSTLATFGKSAAAFQDVAVQQMSSETSLGTGAAQVAAAVGYPEAIPRIIEMINAMVGQFPANEAIPLGARDRLLELAWAIYFAGENGRNASASVHMLMQRKVESRAPPFGIVGVSPKRLCRVLERIEGPAATLEYPYCNDPSIPFEQ